MLKTRHFLKLSIRAAMMVALVMTLFLSVYQPTQASTIPTFSIVSVDKDVSVTIKAYNFPAGTDFTVRMGNYGSLGIGGTVVGTTASGSGGSFTKTYDIPAALKGKERIAIRMDATSGGYYAYNWFWNNPSTPAPAYTGIPTFTITTVEKDSKVTIKTKNFPADKTFKVLMGKYGTLGVGGTEVTTFDSGTGGTFTKTFDIPAGLKGKDRIAIRLESTAGFFAYNWFWNNPSTTPAPSTYKGIPSFTITAVVKDGKVTIKTNNFPADKSFNVLMGKYGTLGIGGTKVTTLNSGTGGTFTKTFDIPAAYKGQVKIAIRLESSEGYYAYNWFWNNNAP
ncbi:MAG: hypothetical protein HGA53_02770 [Anaerolineaceae bacterium]|nr:hypothetical protein [Anaerolineaceae bacterium]